MVPRVGRWMHVGGQGGWKMEEDNGGRTGHPVEFSIPKSNRIDIFLMDTGITNTLYRAAMMHKMSEISSKISPYARH